MKKTVEEAKQLTNDEQIAVLEAKIEQCSKETTEARTALAKLEDEKKKIPGLIREAAQDANADELIGLRTRQNNIEAHIFAAKIGVFRKEIAYGEAREALLDFKNEVADFQGAIKRARARIEETEKALEVAKDELQSTRSADSRLDREWSSNSKFLQKQRHELESLINSSPDGFQK